MAEEGTESEGIPEHPLLESTASHKMLDSYVNLFCPGCGNGIFAQSLDRAFENLKIDPKKHPQYVGIGCHSLSAFLVPGPVMMILHGRAIPFATGVRLSNPEIEPILILGDGDAFSIGTNHFVHGARRNLNVTVLVLNNLNFGMTGGQSSPTTPTGSRTRTSGEGFIERSLDTVEFARTCGATYVARWSVAQPRLLTSTIEEAVQHDGFSFVDIQTPCVTYFGRFNWEADPAEMYRRLEENTVRRDRAEEISAEELETKIVVGKFHEEEEPTLWDGYGDMFRKAEGEST